MLHAIAGNQTVTLNIVNACLIINYAVNNVIAKIVKIIFRTFQKKQLSIKNNFLNINNNKNLVIVKIKL